MKISIKKGENRSRLLCKRENGTYTLSDTGPSLPFHDLAHFVAESVLSLTEGFYGNIAEGRSIEELSDKKVIKTLGAEAWIAEVITRSLQELSSNATTKEGFAERVETELTVLKLPTDIVKQLSEDLIDTMLLQYQQLLSQWDRLETGEDLTLEFNVQHTLV